MKTVCKHESKQLHASSRLLLSPVVHSLISSVRQKKTEIESRWSSCADDTFKYLKLLRPIGQPPELTAKFNKLLRWQVNILKSLYFYILTIIN
jgi:hypothetical protein